MTLAVIDLGTNINPESSLAEALDRLSSRFRLRRSSAVYQTRPVGIRNQADFLNLSLEFETTDGVFELRRTLRDMENAMGRDRTAPKYGPRVIDADLLLLGDRVDPQADLPHPQTLEQLFVVLPLCELYPLGRHPGTGQLWKDVAAHLLAGQTPKDAGIQSRGPIDILGLTERVRQQLA